MSTLKLSHLCIYDVINRLGVFKICYFLKDITKSKVHNPVLCSKKYLVELFQILSISFYVTKSNLE